MLHIFTQSDAARMRADRDIELGRHEQYGKIFINTTHPATVYLADSDGSGLQELFKDNSVLTMFAGSHFNRCYSIGYFFVAKDIVRTGRLFNPPWIEG